MYTDMPFWLSIVFMLGGLGVLAWSSNVFVDGVGTRGHLTVLVVGPARRHLFADRGDAASRWLSGRAAALLLVRPEVRGGVCGVRNED